VKVKRGDNCGKTLCLCVVVHEDNVDTLRFLFLLLCFGSSYVMLLAPSSLGCGFALVLLLIRGGFERASFVAF
jgi:hypothetical protein